MIRGVGIKTRSIGSPVQIVRVPSGGDGGGDVTDGGEWVGLRVADALGVYQITDLVSVSDPSGLWTVRHGCTTPGGSWPASNDAIIWSFAIKDARGQPVDLSSGEYHLMLRLRGLSSSRAAAGIRVWLGISATAGVPTLDTTNPGRAIGADLGTTPVTIAWRHNSTGYRLANPALSSAPNMVAGSWDPSANTTDNTPEMGIIRCTYPVRRSGTGQMSVEGGDALPPTSVLFVGVTAAASDSVATDVTLRPEYRVLRYTPEPSP